MLYAWGKRAYIYILIVLPFDAYLVTLKSSTARDGRKVTSVQAKLFPRCHSSVQNLPTQEKTHHHSPVCHNTEIYRVDVCSKLEANLMCLARREKGCMMRTL